MVLELPLVPYPAFKESIKLAFGIAGPRQFGIDIGLFDLFERRCGVGVQRSIFIIISEVVGLCPCHPLWDILAIFSKWSDGYVELIKYFLRWIATSELYLGSLFPRLVLKKLFWRPRVPMLGRELYILLILLIIIANLWGNRHPNQISFLIEEMCSLIWLFFYKLHMKRKYICKILPRRTDLFWLSFSALISAPKINTVPFSSSILVLIWRVIFMASSKSTTCGGFMPRMNCNLARVMVLIMNTVPVYLSAPSKRTISLVSPLVFNSAVAHRIYFEGIPDKF